VSTADIGLLQFTPLYFTRVWGGRSLARVFGRALPDDQPYGEAWELVDRADAQSLVADGPLAGQSLHQLWTTRRREIFGGALAASTSPRFPLLIKILDCRDDLSVQVHPPVHKADALGGEPKTEMWFMAHAEPNARIYAGLRRGASRESFSQALAAGTVAEEVHAIPVHTGESLFVPSGRVHALGGGLVVYEIQQNSDTTYRVFDWNRTGLDGRPRDLHIDQSMASIDFTDVEPSVRASAGGVLADCPYFTVSRVYTGHRARASAFRMIVPISEVLWNDKTLAPGQLTCAPASFVGPEPSGEWLEIEAHS